MKAAEEYIKKYYPYNEEMDDEEILQLKFMIEVAQKEAYNQAIVIWSSYPRYPLQSLSHPLSPDCRLLFEQLQS